MLRSGAVYINRRFNKKRRPSDRPNRCLLKLLPLFQKSDEALTTTQVEQKLKEDRYRVILGLLKLMDMGMLAHDFIPMKGDHRKILQTQEGMWTLLDLDIVFANIDDD